MNVNRTTLYDIRRITADVWAVDAVSPGVPVPPRLVLCVVALTPASLCFVDVLKCVRHHD